MPTWDRHWDTEHPVWPWLRLDQAIQAVERGRFDVMLLTKTQIQSEAYSHNHLGYDVTCSVVRSSSAMGDQGGVGLVTRVRTVRWGIESTRYHGPNVVSFKIVTGITWTPLTCHPQRWSTCLTLRRPYSASGTPIVLGELNVDLDEARSLWRQCVSDLLTEYCLIDLVWNLRQCRMFRDLKTW